MKKFYKLIAMLVFVPLMMSGCLLDELNNALDEAQEELDRLERLSPEELENEYYDELAQASAKIQGMWYGILPLGDDSVDDDVRGGGDTLGGDDSLGNDECRDCRDEERAPGDDGDFEDEEPQEGYINIDPSNGTITMMFIPDESVECYVGMTLSLVWYSAEEEKLEICMQEDDQPEFDSTRMRRVDNTLVFDADDEGENELVWEQADIDYDEIRFCDETDFPDERDDDDDFDDGATNATTDTTNPSTDSTGFDDGGPDNHGDNYDDRDDDRGGDDRDGPNFEEQNPYEYTCKVDFHKQLKMIHSDESRQEDSSQDDASNPQ